MTARLKRTLRRSWRRRCRRFRRCLSGFYRSDTGTLWQLCKLLRVSAAMASPVTSSRRPAPMTTLRVTTPRVSPVTPPFRFSNFMPEWPPPAPRHVNANATAHANVACTPAQLHLHLHRTPPPPPSSSVPTYRYCPCRRTTTFMFCVSVVASSVTVIAWCYHHLCFDLSFVAVQSVLGS